MRYSTTVARQLCATSIRGATPMASTSRPVLRASIAPHLVPRTASRSLVTIPNPELASSNGSPHVIVQTFGDRIPSVAHALAIMRAVEKRLGPVVSLAVPKDEDTRKAVNTIYLTLLRPVELTERLVLEIPSPVLSRQSTFPGGISYQDVVNALHETPSPVTGGQRGDDHKGKPIQFSVEARRKVPYTPRAHRTERTRGEVREDDAIVRALAAFDGGFNGGLAGIADKFKEFRIEESAEEAQPVEEAVEEVVEEVVEVKQVMTKPVAQAQPKAAPAAKPAAPAPMSRAEKLRQKALNDARRAAAHQQKFEEQGEADAPAVATEARSPQAGHAAPKAQTEAEGKEESKKQGGLLSSLFGSKP